MEYAACCEFGLLLVAVETLHNTLKAHAIGQSEIKMMTVSITVDNAVTPTTFNNLLLNDF